MKIVRLGMTESGLVFMFFLLKTYQFDQEKTVLIKKQILSMVNWLYTTSGYYDKTVRGSHFDFDETALNGRFHEFMWHLETAIGDCEETHFFFHPPILEMMMQYQNAFTKAYRIRNMVILNGTQFTDRIAEVFGYMAGRKVLVVSSFDGLIQSQYQSGNVFKVYDAFPKLASLQTVKTPYTFENDGPDANYHETLETIWKAIQPLDFDVAVLGCGCYGHKLTHHIHAELDRDAIYLGGSITNLFGILTAREKQANVIRPNSFWITDIPEEYRPANYKNIENGCYW